MFIVTLFVETGNWSVSAGRIEMQNVIDVHPGVQPSEEWHKWAKQHGHFLKAKCEKLMRFLTVPFTQHHLHTFRMQIHKAQCTFWWWGW